MEQVETRIGKAIEAERIRQGLSQGELAKKCGMTQASISEIEDGKRKVSLQHLNEIAESLAIKLWVLVRRAESMTRKKAPGRGITKTV